MGGCLSSKKTGDPIKVDYQIEMVNVEPTFTKNVNASDVPSPKLTKEETPEKTKLTGFEDDGLSLSKSRADSNIDPVNLSTLSVASNIESSVSHFSSKLDKDTVLSDKKINTKNDVELSGMGILF